VQLTISSKRLNVGHHRPMYRVVKLNGWAGCTAYLATGHRRLLFLAAAFVGPAPFTWVCLPDKPAITRAAVSRRQPCMARPHTTSNHACAHMPRRREAGPFVNASHAEQPSSWSCTFFSVFCNHSAISKRTAWTVLCRKSYICHTNGGIVIQQIHRKNNPN